MSYIKRVGALAMAAVMLMSVLAAATLQTAMAVPDNVTVTNVTADPSSFTEGDTLTTLKFTVTDETPGIGLDPVSTSATVEVESGSGFTAAANSSLKVSATNTNNGKTDWAQYTITMTNLKVGSNASKLKIKVTDSVTGKTAYSREGIEVTVNGYTSGGGGEPPTPPVTVDENIRYTVSKVSSPAMVNGVQKPASYPRYDINDIKSGSDASIRQTYYVDILVKVTDAALPASGTITAGDIITDDLGGFVFEAANSSVEVKTDKKNLLEITLKAIKYSGNGKKLAFTINDDSYQRDVVLDITECVTRAEQIAENDKNNNTDTSDRLEVETPYVIINKYGYGGGNVTAGDTFSLSLTFLNTSENEEITNMMVTLTMPDDLMLTSSSNTFYVASLKERASITKAVQVTAKPAAKAQSHNINVSMKYQYVDDRVVVRRDATTTENIAIPVVQIDRFQLTAVDVYPEIMLEEESSVSVSFVNKGRSDVFNLAASIDGNITNPGQEQNLGNLASGATGTADFFITPNETGLLTGTITITYEDTNMEEKVATIDYSTMVNSYADMNQGMDENPFPDGDIGVIGPQEQPQKPKWPVYLIVVAVVLIPVAIIVKKRIDRRRREQEDADL